MKRKGVRCPSGPIAFLIAGFGAGVTVCVRGAAGGPALPTPQQIAWQDMELGVFIHFAPNTWQDREYDDLSTPLESINPTRLDTDQWVHAAELLGAKYIVFVAKHVGGFCMWQTETTDYSIRNTPWRGGKGDVLRDLSESCRKRGMKLGVYLSPQDRRHKADVGGRCADPQDKKAYEQLYRRQLTEVLSRYGEMVEVWFDGGLLIDVSDILKKHAPNAMVFQGPCATIRWVGNEDGFAPYPAWNAVPEAAAKSGAATAGDGDPAGTVWLPNECDARIRRDWFWSTRNADTLKSVDQLMEMYYRSVGHGATLLLNLAPDTTGLIPEADVRRAAEFGAEIHRRFGNPRAETKGRGNVVELVLPSPTTIDHVVTMEDIAHGERVRKYVVEAGDGGEWKPICHGSAIGHKKIDRFAPVTVARVRWRCEESASEPIIRRLAVYSAEDFAIRDGDVVGFLGDSITAARTYGKIVENYTLLRYPDRKVRFINIGWGGDTAEGGLKRLDADVFARGVTLLTVAYGINDIGWGAKADAEHRQKYLDSIRRIVERCRERGVRVYICSAAATAEDPKTAESGFLQLMCDDAMLIARSLGGGAIDVQRTMRECQRRVLAANAGIRDETKKDSLHAADGIHLNEYGQIAMAYAILKGLGAPAEVSSAVLDARGPAVVEAKNCTVTDVSGNDDRLEFMRLDRGLPLNLGLIGLLSYRFVPIPDGINRYMLAVRNLRSGRYEILVDDRKLGIFPSEQLAAGVNIASATPDAWEPGGPWDAQAALLRHMTDARNELELSRTLTDRYVPRNPNRASLNRRADDINTWIEDMQREVARPVPYRFVIRPAPNP